MDSCKDRIKALREEKRMTQTRLSIELEVTQETISAYESGRHYPGIPVLIKMSELFGVSCDYILGVSDVRTIMTGLRSDSDIEIVSKFNALTPMEQNQARAYIQALLDRRKAIGENNE